MDMFFGGVLNESALSENHFAHKDIQRCPFLRNIKETTNFSFSTSAIFPNPVRVGKGPIFVDGPNFEMTFRLFHGQDGVVPLSGKSGILNEDHETKRTLVYNPLASKAATMSLSAFRPGGPFSFDSFSKNWKKGNKKASKQNSSQEGGNSSHETVSNQWLETGQCPIAKSCRAVSRVIPLVAKAMQPPSGMKLRCPPAVVAARAALACTALVKSLRPQPLPSKMLAIAILGMAANVPLGIWREHTLKFSPQWFIAVHAAVPFIAMLRKSVLMPKTTMALTVAASILGQTVGSRSERLRLKAKRAAAALVLKPETAAEEFGEVTSKDFGLFDKNKLCGDGEQKAWETLPRNSAGSTPLVIARKANVCC